MRKALTDALLQQAADDNMVFLTGDLGYSLLEPLQIKLGSRFINAGVAEQNMISVAAALAQQNFNVWAYSIAPFIYARPFEQVRNDISFHNLSVKLIGNGGGYGYGVMGPTHHAIDDYGVLLTLPKMSVYIPVFDEDVSPIVGRAAVGSGPSYIRLGRAEPPDGYMVPAYAPWRQLTQGGGAVVVAVGPLATTYIAKFRQLPEHLRPNLWCVSELPFSFASIPADLIVQIQECSGLCVAEEHVMQGGIGSQLMMQLALHKIQAKKIRYLCAKAHQFERYGSQNFMRHQSGLDIDTVLTELLNIQND